MLIRMEPGDDNTAIFDERISANHAGGGLHRASAPSTGYARAGRSAGV